jgi:hypothetical protein
VQSCFQQDAKSYSLDAENFQGAEAMSNHAELAKRYMAIWNEADPERRRAAIAKLWERDAVHFTPSLEAHGYDAIEARVKTAYDKYVGTGEYVFKPAAADADEHHNAVRLRWEMVPPTGGEVAAAGSVFIILGDDGRIRTDYQFTDPTPQA